MLLTFLLLVAAIWFRSSGVFLQFSGNHVLHTGLCTPFATWALAVSSDGAKETASHVSMAVAAA